MPGFRIISTYVENTFHSSKPLSYLFYHLHIRGEYFDVLNTLATNVGSSPHTWRIQATAQFYKDSDRIISTYVENTPCRVYNASNVEDHLHIRGEYVNVHYTSLVIPGSSPHTWRIPVALKLIIDYIRIISTYVENTYRLGQN